MKMLYHLALSQNKTIKNGIEAYILIYNKKNI